MESTFQKALAHILLYEGGYSDHPRDPGGATNLGITQSTLQRFRRRPVSKNDVKQITHDEAARIYREFYWNSASCNALPAGIDLAVFDCAVNQGVGRATRLLQQSVKVKADGVIGPVTLAAINKSSAVPLLSEFIARRMNAYGRLQKLFSTFGLGWSRRLIATHRAALSLISPSPLPSQTFPSKSESLPMLYILKRLQEPSTYAGLAAILAALGLLNLTEQEWNNLFGAIAAAAGALAMLLSDRPKTEPPKKSSFSAFDDIH